MYLESGARDVRRLQEEIKTLAAHIHAATARWLGLVAELDEAEGWTGEGFRSCAHWLSFHCGVGLNAAREQVRVARRLRELPIVAAAFERGELSYSKVRAMSRLEKVEDERTLLTYALCATAAQLERMVSGYRDVVVRELGADGAGRRRVDHWTNPDGTVSIRATLPPEEAEIVLRALEVARENLCAEEDDGITAVTPRPNSADALVRVADGYIAQAEAGHGRSGADRFQVVVHVDADSLTGSDPSARSELEDGTALPQETARRLACDASLVRILERDGRPLSVGRKTRSIPPALRRALRSRDRTCRFPGCTQRHHLDAHHVRHWAKGGATDLGNLVHLCHHHHKLLHEYGYGLEVKPNGVLRFLLPDGTPLPPVPEARCGDVGRLRAGNRAHGADVGPTTCASLSSYEPISYPNCVEGLLTVAPVRVAPGI